MQAGAQQINARTGVSEVEATHTSPDGASSSVKLASNDNAIIPLADVESYEDMLQNARLLGAPGVGAGQHIRKSHLSLTPAEWTQFKNAIDTLMTSPSLDGNAHRYDDFVQVHMKASANGWGAHDMGSDDGRNFLAWHREFLCKFEEALMAAGGIPIPYWDWYNGRTIPAQINDPTDLTKWEYFTVARSAKFTYSS